MRSTTTGAKPRHSPTRNESPDTGSSSFLRLVETSTIACSTEFRGGTP